MRIELRDTPFDPWRALAGHQSSQPQLRGRHGATASFVGTLRDNNDGDAVLGMVLEHYPGMTERHLQRIADEAQSRWELLDLLVIHRTGELRPGDPIVLVAVWAAHRAAAFAACRFIMEALKSRAPFWKQELLPAGRRWVEKNTPG
ncbi:MAG: molybdenum cofactor biosynthesis protein MoaE [Pseudomonadota bacterium]|nr:molybdenum cofactor biosynthesis protein MoaE [Pseudomonadota bacterium]